MFQVRINGGGQECKSPKKIHRLLEAVPDKTRVSLSGMMPSKAAASSFIYAEAGKTPVSAWERPFYATWNSIPIKHSLQVGVELLGSMLGGKKKMDLQPNYATIGMTPLEFSFTRRPDGMWNFVKDIFQGKPYRLLSEMREGWMFSPAGGSLAGIFPKTITAMLDDPNTLAILKQNRDGFLASIVNAYSKLPKNPALLGNERLVGYLGYVGQMNSRMLFMEGFRDSLLQMADARIRELSGGGGLHSQIRASCTDYSPAFSPGRGVDSGKKWRANTAFLESELAYRNFEKKLGGAGKRQFELLPEGTKSEIRRLFAIREELAQELLLKVEPIEHCRAKLYEFSAEVGRRLAETGKWKATDASYLTMDEMEDALSGKIGPGSAQKRKEAKPF